MQGYVFAYILLEEVDSLQTYFCTRFSTYSSISAAGDVLLTSAYLSYVGCFSRNYRQILINEKWLPYLKTLNVRSMMGLFCKTVYAGADPGGGSKRSRPLLLYL